MNALQFLESHKGHSDYIDIERYPYPVLIPRFLSYGDCDSSCFVERSNYQVFLENFGSNPWVKTISGGYGYSAIALHPNALKDNEILETLAALESYPCLDDEHCQNLEREAYLEYWLDTGNSDFIDALANKFNLQDVTKDYLDSLEQDTLRNFYQEDHSSGAFYYSEAGGGIYIDFKDETQHITRDLLADFIKTHREEK